jgi:hypothetical protein
VTSLAIGLAPVSTIRTFKMGRPKTNHTLGYMIQEPR